MRPKQWSAVLFWGGLWGISEATVSYLLHLFAPGYGWVLYYPLAYAFMTGVFLQSGKTSSILWASALSAAIKLINLLMTPRIDYVINPAVAILLEGLVMFCAIRFVPSQQKAFNRFLAMPLATSLAWRCLYLLYLAAMPAWIREVSVLGKAGPMLNFLLLETAVNSAVIAFGALAVRGAASLRRSGSGDKKALPGGVFAAVSLAVLALSVFLQWAL